MKISEMGLPAGAIRSQIPGTYLYEVDDPWIVNTVTALAVESVPDWVPAPQWHTDMVARVLPHKVRA